MAELRMTTTTRLVLQALAMTSEPTWGYSLCRATGLQSGTVYPILNRLASRGLVTVDEELGRHPGRPPRRYYQLTAAGQVRAGAIAR
ncbi:PadR family transcriptional regulator [Streptomyces griseoincarnatus]